jgi:hypothetical protein
MASGRFPCRESETIFRSGAKRRGDRWSGGMVHGAVMLQHVLHLVRLAAGACTDHDGLVAAFRQHIGMAHIAVEIDRLPRLQRNRLVEFGVDANAAADDIDPFFTAMADKVAKLVQRAGADVGDDGDHPLLSKFREQIEIIVVCGADPKCRIQQSKAPSRRHPVRLADGLRLREQIRKTHVEAFGQLQQPIIGQRQSVMLDLGERRDRDPRPFAHVLQRPLVTHTKRAQ